MSDVQEAPEIGGEDKVDYSQFGWDEPEQEAPEPVGSEPEEPPASDEDDTPASFDGGMGDPDWSDSDEDLARKFGWKPRTEWKGDVPPTFVDDPREFVASKTRALDEFSSLKEQLAATRRELMRLEQQQGEAFKSQTESRLASLEAEREKAFDLGDKKKFRELDDQIKNIYAEQAKRPAQEPQIDPVTQQATQSSVYQDWVSQNPWYLGNSFEDAAKRAYADKVGPELLQQRGLSPQDVLGNAQIEREFYQAVAAEVNRAYGGQQNPMQQRSVPNVPQQQGRQSATPPRRGKTEQSFAKLPEDAKQAFAYYVKRGVYQDSDKDRADYTREFLSQ